MTINEIVDADLKAKAEIGSAERDPLDVFHISSLGLCLKGAYYQRLGAKEPYSPDKLRIFELGHVLEDRVEAGLMDAGVLHMSQQRVEYPEYDLRGTCDFVIKDELGNFKLVEMKTMNSNGFRVMESKQEGPKMHHAIQVSLYWNKLKELYPGLTASVLYVCKDTFKMYEANLTQDQLDAGVKLGLYRAETLKKAWDAKVPPEVEEEAWVERYCGVHTYCNKLQTL